MIKTISLICVGVTLLSLIFLFYVVMTKKINAKMKNTVLFLIITINILIVLVGVIMYLNI